MGNRRRTNFRWVSNTPDSEANARDPRTGTSNTRTNGRDAKTMGWKYRQTKSPSIWDNEKGVSVYLKNWGNIPARPCEMKGIITAYKITKEDIIALEPDEGGFILPKSDYEWRIDNDDQVPKPKTEAEQFFVGFLIEYGYGNNKKDVSGFVAEYDLLLDSFTFPEYW
jgi:hypothetical protein